MAQPFPTDQAGGQIVAGTYFLSNRSCYSTATAGCATTQTSATDIIGTNGSFSSSETIVLEAGSFSTWVVGTITTSGTTLTGAATCEEASDGGVQLDDGGVGLTAPYTATATTLKIYYTANGYVDTYTKQ